MTVRAAPRAFAPLALVLVLAVCTGTDRGPAPVDGTTSPVAEVRWERLPPAPTARTEVTAVTDGGRIFVIGGFAQSGETTAAVEVYDPAARKWSSGPDLPVAVNHAMSAGVGGTVYVAGGYLGPGLANPSDRAFLLRGNRWEELPRMPEARAASGAAVVNGRLVVAGGVGPDGLAESLLTFDPQAASWTSTTGPRTRREHLGVAGFGGRLYVVGGRTGGIGSNLGAAEAYDPGTSEWTKLPDLPTPRGGIAAAATSNGFVVAAGGEAERTFAEAEAFDVERGRWISLPPMPTARHGLGVVAVGTVVYVIAGGPEPGFSFSNANEAIDLAPLTR